MKIKYAILLCVVIILIAPFVSASLVEIVEENYVFSVDTIYPLKGMIYLCTYSSIIISCICVYIYLMKKK